MHELHNISILDKAPENNLSGRFTVFPASIRAGLADAIYFDDAVSNKDFLLCDGRVRKCKGKQLGSTN